MEIPCHVFCCYARKDQDFLYDIKVHLNPLEREGLITIKADIDVSPGMEWETTILHHLEVADIILLLISPDFIASDYCFNEEMRRAIVRHEQGTARVVPVIIRPTSWHIAPLSKLQALPKDATPISLWQNKDTAFLNVTDGIRLIVQELRTGISDSQQLEHSMYSLAKEGLSQSISKKRSNMDTRDDSRGYTINNQGSVYGQINGDNYGPIIINKKDGIRALEMGTQALWNKDYSSARKNLRTAIEEIDQMQCRSEAARARYLQVLAVLAGERPRDKGIVAMEKIDELLNAAINIDQCNAYVMTKAVIRNPSVRRQGMVPHITDYDRTLLAYLEHCQPDLYYQVRQVFGI